MAAQTDFHLLLHNEFDRQSHLIAKGVSFDTDGNILALTVDGEAFVAEGTAGDVTGPASSVADTIVAFSGTTGKILKAPVKPVVPLTTPDVQDIIDALITLGLVTQSD